MQIKKLIIPFIAVIVCLAAAGCKKDSQNTKVYLLKQQVTDDREDGIPIDTTTYSYDEKDRITGITDGSGTGRITMSIVYDSQNRISVARKYNSTGGLIIEFDFFYDGGDAGYYFFGPTHIADTASLTFNNARQVTEISTKHSGSQVFTYDSKGNIATSQAISSSGSSHLNDQISFSYDAGKNPLSQAAPNNYFVMYIINTTNPSTFINNVLIKNADKYTYTYNKDGFPVSLTIKTYLSKIYVYYTYIQK
ncbi:MAG TPA: hypothetical protein VHC47_11335 [Mucilaginibacter sp.]|nr:hypothetical protein [Mucilaginibacter sp.]